jgi:hypothetical protein
VVHSPPISILAWIGLHSFLKTVAGIAPSQYFLQGHFYSTQNAPPHVNFQRAAAGGTVGGGSSPCAISNYSGLEPAYYTFDLSLGYDTGDLPPNPHLKNVGIRLVIQNTMNKMPLRIPNLGGNPPTRSTLRKAFRVARSDSPSPRPGDARNGETS